MRTSTDADDLNETVEALVAEAPAEATVGVFHTAVLASLGDAGRERFAVTMRGQRPSVA